MTYSYIRFELKINTFPSDKANIPLVLVRYSSLPEVLLNPSGSITYSADEMDGNGFAFRKSSQVVVYYFGSNYQSGGSMYTSCFNLLIRYVSVYKHTFTDPALFDFGTINFDITRSIIDADSCPYSCLSGSFCRYRECSCRPEFFGPDCSVKLPLVAFGENKTVTATAKGYTHVAVYMSSTYTIDINIKLISTKDEIYPYVILNGAYDFKIPSVFENNGIDYGELRRGTNILRVTQGRSFISYIVIGIWNKNPTDEAVNFSLAFNSEEVSNLGLIIILGVVIGVIILLIILVGLLKKCIRRNRNNQPPTVQFNAPRAYIYLFF